jgi:hypothetical protein
MLSTLNGGCWAERSDSSGRAETAEQKIVQGHIPSSWVAPKAAVLTERTGLASIGRMNPLVTIQFSFYAQEIRWIVNMSL